MIGHVIHWWLIGTTVPLAAALLPAVIGDVVQYRIRQESNSARAVRKNPDTGA